MWRRVSAWLHRVSTGWATLVALIVFALFMGLVLPRQAADAEMDAGGAGSPDTSLWYSPHELYEMAQAYGEEGRQAYVRARFTFDLVWPLVYAAFLSTAISWLSRKAFPADTLWQRANLAPLLGLVLDYAENVSTSLIMVRFPARTLLVDWLASLFTLAKWLFVGGSFLLLTLAAGAATWRWFASRPADVRREQ
jgi:hypothetical protein